MASQLTDEQLTIKEAADLLHCSVPTIRRLIDRGLLPAYRYAETRVIRVDPRDIERIRKPVTPLAEQRAREAKAGELR